MSYRTRRESRIELRDVSRHLVRMLDAGRIGRSVTVVALRGSAVREFTVAPVDHAARPAAPERWTSAPALGVLAATG